MKDYGGKEGLALDYRGSLPHLTGRDHALDHVPFDSPICAVLGRPSAQAPTAAQHVQ